MHGFLKCVPGISRLWFWRWGFPDVLWNRCLSIWYFCDSLQHQWRTTPPRYRHVCSITLAITALKPVIDRVSNNLCWTLSPPPFPPQRPLGRHSTWTNSSCLDSSYLSPWWSCFGCWLHERVKMMENDFPADLKVLMWFCSPAWHHPLHHSWKTRWD